MGCLTYWMQFRGRRFWGVTSLFRGVNMVYRICLFQSIMYVFVVIVTILSVSSGSAETIYVGASVPSDYADIQSAIDGARSGDVIVISPGRYVGIGNRDIDFRGKPLTIRSMDPNDPGLVSQTIIDCNGTADEPHRGFHFHTGEDCRAVVSGLTVTHGYGPAEDAWGTPISSGGGVYCCESNPTLVNCVFVGNSASRGGAICTYYSEAHLENCVFRGNSSEVWGGGVFDYHGSPLYTRCTFDRNVSGYGGAVSHSCYSTVTFIDCLFVGNRAEYENYGSGGVLYNYSDTAILIGCLLVGNSAGRSGGAIYAMGNIRMTNCVMVGNWAGYRCGGVDIAQSWNIATGPTKDGIFTNCILWDNRNGDQSDRWAQLSVHGVATFNYCAVQGWNETTRDIYCGPVRTIFGPSDERMWIYGIGTTDVIPCFANPGHWDPNGSPADPNDDFWVDGDYHLKSKIGRWDPYGRTWVQDDVSSLCIDAGDPNMPVGDEPMPNGRRINIGVYGGTDEASMSSL